MLQWVAADMRTGRVLADLPSLDAEYPLTRTISEYTAATVHLHLDGAPENWVRATQPGAAVLACYDDRTLDSTPGPVQWAGYVKTRHRDGSTDIVDLAVETLEGYLDRRYVPDMTVTAGWRTVVASLITSYARDGAAPGIPLAVVYSGAGDAPDTPLVWQNTDNVTVLGRITELADQFNGEFTIEWAWSGDGESLVPTLMLGDRIGQPVTAGLGPAVTFDLPGSVTSAEMDEDYSSDSGANTVVAYSSGQGEYTPYAPAVTAVNFDNRATFEYRYSPVASEARTARLQKFARGALAILAPGRQTFTLTVTRANDLSRRFGVDWRLGDDIGYVIADTVPAFPGGLAGVGRPISVDVNENDVTPTFEQPEIYTEDGS